mmetsp:Transcript_28837/g.70329  ORF Transcript_28837/g.70329 Transcript_28837/m.70329 type:complete len:80 (+) Transcript_28837:60-299(+)
MFFRESSFTVQIKDIKEYIEYFPKEIRIPYRNAVERILNLNGHSLMLDDSTYKKFDPKVLASFFIPISEPAVPEKSYRR